MKPTYLTFYVASNPSLSNSRGFQSSDAKHWRGYLMLSNLVLMFFEFCATVQWRLPIPFSSDPWTLSIVACSKEEYFVEDFMYCPDTAPRLAQVNDTTCRVSVQPPGRKCYTILHLWLCTLQTHFITAPQVKSKWTIGSRVWFLFFYICTCCIDMTRGACMCNCAALESLWKQMQTTLWSHTQQNAVWFWIDESGQLHFRHHPTISEFINNCFYSYLDAFQDAFLLRAQ